MPREKEAFRDNLERLNLAFPEKEMLNVSDVRKYCGIGDKRAKKTFPFINCLISKATLARYMSPPYNR